MHDTSPSVALLRESQKASRWPVLFGAILLTGLTAGVSGTLLAFLLHAAQHFAYGYKDTGESFTQAVVASSGTRRLFVLSICGFVAGLGWWVVYRFGSPLVSIHTAVTSGKRMPAFTTAAHDLLQLVTVALGSPLGREVAPREMGSVLASIIARWIRLTDEETRTLVACGAGAGLAAVYNVPLGGALFALEALLGTFRLAAVVPALATSAIAAYVAWIGLGDQTQYILPDLAISRAMVTWALLAGPAFGFSAYWFRNAVKAARTNAPHDWRLPLWCGTVFPVIGLLAIPLPEILGNGKGLALLSFDSRLTIGAGAFLLVAKVAAVIACLRAGAEGGLLTPSVAIGSVLATVIGEMWNRVGFAGNPGDYAVVGAAAFLASSMRMPLTAIALTMEFTRVDHDFLIPMALCVAGSICTSELCTLRANTVTSATVKTGSGADAPEHAASR